MEINKLSRWDTTGSNSALAPSEPGSLCDIDSIVGVVRCDGSVAICAWAEHRTELYLDIIFLKYKIFLTIKIICYFLLHQLQKLKIVTIFPCVCTVLHSYAYSKKRLIHNITIWFIYKCIDEGCYINGILINWFMNPSHREHSLSVFLYMHISI